jgi:threonine synthase
LPRTLAHTNGLSCAAHSVDGSFDDCQAIVKAAFADKAFREEVSLGAVNSINWARVLAQMTYYFWAYFRVTDAQVS